MISKLEIIKHNKKDDMWIVIDNKVYNITEYISKHPGGDFICQNPGGDCTHLFYSTHSLNTIKNLVKFLPNESLIGEIDKKDDIKNVFSFNDHRYFQLKQKIEKYFLKINNKDYYRIYIETILTFIIYLISFYKFFLLGYNIIWFFINVFMACLMVGIGHNADHGNLFNSYFKNNIISYFMNFIGIGSKRWRYSHNTLHHGYTNSEFDPDINNPVLRFSENTKPNKINYYQYIHFYFLIFFSIFLFIIDDILFEIQNGLIFSPLVTIIVTIIKISLFKISSLNIFTYLSFLFLNYTLISFIISLLFVLNHTQENAQKNNKIWWLNQIETSCNYSSGSNIVNFLTMGLNHQIEHHLFPNICYIHLPEISKIVKSFCLENNIQYNNYENLIDAIKDNNSYLKKLSS